MADAAVEAAHLHQVVFRDGCMARVQHGWADPGAPQVLVRMERHLAPDPHREHVLDRDRHAGAPHAVGEALLHPAAERALPSVRRVDDHERHLGVGRNLDRAFDLADRVGAPDPAGEQEAGGVDRADRQSVLRGQVRIWAGS